MKMVQRIHTNRCRRLVVIGTFATLTMGCNAITDTQLPDGVERPATYNNREGATRLTQAARNELAKTVAGYIVSSGLLTDELSANTARDRGPVLDQRIWGWEQTRVDPPPHPVRSLARLARGVVGKYVPGETSVWQALLLMYEAYAEILTADGWCSGVPLSTLDFEEDWTYKAGSTTDEIYAHAIQLLDSADARATDSVTLRSAIRVLKARAQLALGHYADAKQAAQGIDDAFRYTLRIAFNPADRASTTYVQYVNFISTATISDNEGINGLPYRSSGDPRTSAVPRTYENKTVWFPAKYVTTDSSTFTLASGIEAQLVLAEVAFHEDNPSQMMTVLNALRTSGSYTVDTTQLTGGSERIDTVWHAGIGGVAGLRPLQLPATSEAQRQRLFAERAAWLFVTGSRQGDLRRLVRKYGMNREAVYPTGQYTGPGSAGMYGAAISFALGPDEYKNPLFTGCQSDD